MNKTYFLLSLGMVSLLIKVSSSTPELSKPYISINETGKIETKNIIDTSNPSVKILKTHAEAEIIYTKDNLKKQTKINYDDSTLSDHTGTAVGGAAVGGTGSSGSKSPKVGSTSSESSTPPSTSNSSGASSSTHSQQKVK